MVFPYTVQDIKSELYLNATWTDISGDVRRDPGITIKRGRGDETRKAEASSCELAIDNDSGDYSPRNPTGQYFGQLGRNTPVRVSILSDKSWMPMDENTGTATAINATTPDSSVLDITGDIDLRFEADLDSWFDTMELVSKWTETGNQRSFIFYMSGSHLLFASSSAGSAVTVSTISTVIMPFLYGRHAVRVTFDVNNGASGNTATFYTSDSIDGTWTQLGATVVTAGTTSIFNSTATVAVGNKQGASALQNVIRGKIYAAEIYNGIAGTLVAAPDFTIQTEGDTSFVDQANGALTGSTATSQGLAATNDYLIATDADAADIAIGDYVILTDSGGTYKEQTVFTVTAKASGFGFTNISYTPNSAAATTTGDIMKEVGNVWTLAGTATTLRDYRFWGEVSAWPQEWDPTGADVYTQIEAAGIIRRLGQGQSPVPSAIYRTVSSDADMVAYWPAEDGENSSSLASAFTGHQAMRVGGTPALADNSDWQASNALPTLNFAQFVGIIPNYTSTDNAQVKFFLSIPAAGIANGIIIATLTTNGTARRWDLVYGTGGTLQVRAYDSDDVSIFTGGAGAFLMNGRPAYVNMRLIDNGTGVDINVVTIDASTGAAATISTANLAAFQVGRAVRLTINPENRMDDVVMGHFSVQKDSGYTEATLIATVLAWAGEVAAQRIKRLCAENDIPFFQVAAIDDTKEMGRQLPGKTVLELLQECADTDMGILYEPRDNYGLKYRTRKSLNNQLARATIAYTSGALTVFKPVDDDQSTVNDVTVTRIGGSSFRAVDETSALSTQEPPNGVGIYDDAPSISLFEDGRLGDQAGWRLHLGTVDEARFPIIAFDLTSPSFLAVTDLTFDVLGIDVGDRLVVTDSPAWLPPDDVQQIAQGFTEYLANFERRISINCSPASPWEVARYANETVSGGNQYKYSSDGTVTTEALDTTETGIDISTPSGPVWTTEAAQFPFDIMIGGERITVAGITGTGTAQVMTPVTRSVNGVVKSHASGVAVVLFRPAVYAL